MGAEALHNPTEHPFTTEEPATEDLKRQAQELSEVPDERITTTVFETRPSNKIVEKGHETEEEEEDEDEEDWLSADEELYQKTEYNRNIPYHEKHTPASPLVTPAQRQLLVFSNNPLVEKAGDKVVVTNYYGRTENGKPGKRQYFAACDFSPESFYAMEWVMGTMMRDGDVLHVVTVVNREDNPVEASKMDLAHELELASNTITEKAKQTMRRMMLFDVKLVTWAIAGRVKDVLATMIQELPLTMVVCGSRGRGMVKGFLMGSISTFLIHNSVVPVCVVREHEKKKKVHKKHTEPRTLSESIRKGQLAVDELSTKK